VAKMKFRVLDGGHCCDDGRIAHRGEIVESNVDLHARFDQPGCPPKFERVGDGHAPEYAIQPGESIEAFAKRMAEAAKRAAKPIAAEEDDVFESMTDDELRKHCAEEELTVSSEASREQLLAACRRG